MLVHPVIRFVATVSFKTTFSLIELRNYFNSKSEMAISIAFEQNKKQITPCERAWKTAPENGVESFFSSQKTETVRWRAKVPSKRDLTSKEFKSVKSILVVTIWAHACPDILINPFENGGNGTY